MIDRHFVLLLAVMLLVGSLVVACSASLESFSFPTATPEGTASASPTPTMAATMTATPTPTRIVARPEPGYG